MRKGLTWLCGEKPKAELPAVCAGDSRHAFGTDRNQSTRLAEHDLGVGRRNLLAEKTQALAMLLMTVCPAGKFIRCRHVADVGRASAHDEAEHHLGVAAVF